MDSFFGSHWNQPRSRPRRHSSASRWIPVQSMDDEHAYWSPPKTMQIPVHFVGSESRRSAQIQPVGSETIRSTAALKIQKVFKGFLVRKSVKRILSIRREVDEIERRISRADVVELIRKDEKERLRVNETLMALLIKLDAVPGVDSGVRVCRRAVTKKAIALQDRVDSIVSAARCEMQDVVVVAEEANREEKEEKAQEKPNSGPEAIDEVLETEKSIHDRNILPHPPSQDDMACCDHFGESLRRDSEESGANVNACTDIDGKLDSFQQDDDSVEAFGNSGMGDVCDVFREDRMTPCFSAECPEESVETSPSFNSAGRGGEDKENIWEKVEEDDFVEVEKPIGEEMMERGAAEEGIAEIAEEEEGGKGKDKRNRELLEKLLDDNEKMMKMMSQLFERNEIQTRMLHSLSQRVEHLEKAFMCDRLRKKKKRHAA